MPNAHHSHKSNSEIILALVRSKETLRFLSSNRILSTGGSETVKNRYKKSRLTVQAIFFVLVLYICVGHYLGEKHIAELPGIAGLHAVCPFGGVVTIHNQVTAGSCIQKIHPSNLFVKA